MENEKIEIGKYYLDKDGELLYCFGEETYEEGAGIELPASEKSVPENFKNFLAMNVKRVISIKNNMNFKNSISTITVNKNTDEVADLDNKWEIIEPQESIKDRFQKSSYFLSLLKKFIDHMQENYLSLYKKEEVRAKDIYKD